MRIFPASDSEIEVKEITAPLWLAKTLRTAIVISSTFLIACFGILVWSFYYGIAAKRTPFSPVEWKEKANIYAHSNDPGCVRGGMALDIVAANLLRRKLIAEVKSLLGEPDGTKETGVYYELGQCSGFGLYNSVLFVHFSSNQQVTHANILRH